MIYRGSMILVVAPSGAGKSSLVAALLEADPTIALSISCTTRSPRPKEEHGREYFFISLEEFLQRQAEGDFLESAQVHDHFYGTSRSWIAEKMQMGRDVILEIDWQGARQIRSLVPQAIWIFILPPSIDSLEERLLRRGQDDPLTIQKRVKAAYAELSHSTEADYIVVNDVFEKALEELRQIISVSRLRTMPQFLRHHDLVQALGIQASPDRLK